MLKERVRKNVIIGRIRREIMTQIITNKICLFNERHWQNHVTPFDIVDRMIETVNVSNKKILVLFNIEFVEQLIYKYNVSAKNICFLADNDVDRLIAKEMYFVRAITVHKVPKWQKLLLGRITSMGSKHFDLTFSNPPYVSGLDLKIMQIINEITDEMVIVHPSTWLIDLKGKSKLFNDTKTMFDGKIKSVTLFNGNPIFGIGLFVPCSITHIDNNKSEDPITVNHFGQKFSADGVDNLTKFGSEWKTIVEPFMLKVKEYVNKHCNVWAKHINYSFLQNLPTNKFYCQLAQIRGHVYGDGLHDVVVQDDFYTMVMKNSEKNKGIRKTSRTPTFEFETEGELYNFISYLKTNFARFCLAVLKDKSTIDCGEMTLIPWLDFTQEWGDEKLFEYFNIDKETQDYINSFIPNYYKV